MSKEHLNRDLLIQRISNNFEEDKYYFQKCDNYLDTLLNRELNSKVYIEEVDKTGGKNE